MTIVLTIIVLLVVSLWFTVTGHRTAQRSETDRLERKLDAVMEHLGVAEPWPAGIEEVDRLILEGKRVEAVKRYRELTGDGLLDAKNAVDRRARGLGR
ncbi:hypothetical protein ACFQBY_07930 [Promicromonospora citrea]|uniref:Ribosomal L7/L12-like protein n=1 Tax=Promicromonospora citrea TaxID=43677 RepID=A0A8H9L5J7_9MICO|nr:hypothetical protein [Promicromonospora citrea]NNH55048.1 hypothetical protein [Promicromonospora citrea]GGM32876.1 hypothetical protein GCM10010102_30470 [Promicromonospora citrea]